MRAVLAGLFLALAASFAALAQTAAPAPAAADAQPAPDVQPTLDELRGNSRVVVVFADDPKDPKFVQQMAWLDGQPAELDERNVVVLVDTDPKANGPLRQRLRPVGFGVVLIDIDGTIAHRRPLPTTVRELANFIDRMPSRRQETGSHRP